MKVCSNCGNENKDKEEFCRRCGFPLYRSKEDYFNDKDEISDDLNSNQIDDYRFDSHSDSISGLNPDSNFGSISNSNFGTLLDSESDGDSVYGTNSNNSYGTDSTYSNISSNQHNSLNQKSNNLGKKIIIGVVLLVIWYYIWSFIYFFIYYLSNENEYIALISIPICILIYILILKAIFKRVDS